MELRQLRSFCTVANTTSFTRAAEILGYAQSSITTQIQLLEQELGTKLFYRTGKHVTLTSDGECFLTYVRQILHLSAEAKEAISGLSIPKGSITIGAPESLCSTRLPVILKEYRRRNPQVKIALKTGVFEDFREWMKTHLIDVAFFLQQETSYSELITKTLNIQPMVVACGAGHALISKGTIAPADLRDETLIVAERSCGYSLTWENMLSKAGIYPETVLEFSSITAMKQFAICGLGITLLPRVAIAQELETGTLVDLHWAGEDFGIVTQIAYHKNKWLSPALTSFLALTNELFQTG